VMPVACAHRVLPKREQPIPRASGDGGSWNFPSFLAIFGYPFGGTLPGQC
jgi:hypothetical protein